MKDSDWVVENAHNDNLPPLPPPEEIGEEAGPGTRDSAPSDGGETSSRVLCTPEQVLTFLRLGYKAGAWKTGYDDLWAVSDELLTEIAVRITPDINTWPEIFAKTIAYGDQKSGWALLVYDYGRRVLLSIQRHRAEQRAPEGGEDHAGSSGLV